MRKSVSIFEKSIHLPNRALDHQIELMQNEGKLANVSLKVLKIQAHILTATNNEGKSVLHVACNKGHLKMVEFIHSKASDKYLNILPFLINV